jgi:hypothetical protein
MMKPSFLSSMPSAIIALIIGGVAVVAAMLYFSFHDLEESLVDGGKQALPSPRSAEVRSLPTTGTSALSVQEPTVVPSAQTMTESPVDPGATPDTEMAVPIGSEVPVPAVFGILAHTNALDPSVAEGLEVIAQEFAEKVKLGGWDTTTEAYRANWEKATQEVDDTIRARYGTDLYLNLKRRAAP